VVDDKEQVNALSTKDLRNLFKLRSGTPSDTHDKLCCERCKIIADHAEIEAVKVLPKKLAACGELLTRIEQHEDAAAFLKPLVPQDHDVSKEEYEKAVKQPIDLGYIGTKLNLSVDQPGAYNSVSGFSKDVNRIFANVMKVWSPGQDIADAARRLQAWWVDEWTELVPVLMTMKSDVDQVVKKEDEDPVDAACANTNNERGEDFQEQIGMPDEENMRSWSHHYDTDTVDDPVFRAAMRGCDSVSFVFGLEVTWSLIQQRQQEEEEREAMKELEAIQELEEALKEEAGESSLGDEGIVDGGTAESPKLDVTGDEPKVETQPRQAKVDVNGDTAESPELDGTEDETEEEVSPEKAETDDDDDDDDDDDSREGQSADEIMRSEVDVDEGPSQSQSGTDEAASPESREVSSSTDTESSQSEKSKAPSGGESPASSTRSSQSDGSIEPSGLGGGKENQSSQSLSTAAVSNGKWGCNACTYENIKRAKKCKMCATARPPQARKRTIDEVSY
jgi:hypothetical protein